jgi:pimeloyl-ACP methyl ester carboxylesterase
MPTIQVNDIHMYYEIYGEGKPLVLINGLGSDLSEIDRLTRWLAQKYRVLVFDNRGAGRTDKPDMPYSIEMMAEDTAQLLNALGIEQASVLGISMGGRIALALALRHPERVAKLILVSTSARVSDSKKRRRWFRLLSLVSSTPIFKSKYPQPRYAFLRQLQALHNYNCTDQLDKLHIPTIIMHGKRDQSVPYLLAEEMHHRIRGSRMIPFQGGHLFFLISRHQQFLNATTEFLES